MLYENPNEIQKLENEIYEINKKLEKLRKDQKPTEVKNYELYDMFGKTDLLSLFNGKDSLMVIHNMGQGCRYCTLWADGFNGFVNHLESKFSFVVLSKDEPSVQRQFANSRGWRFRMVSHLGKDYIKDQSVIPGQMNTPGMVCYEKVSNKIYRKNFSVFGPRDAFCSFWSMISLAGYDEDNFTPQYNYWSRPVAMDDGGQNLN